MRDTILTSFFSETEKISESKETPSEGSGRAVSAGITGGAFIAKNHLANYAQRSLGSALRTDKLLERIEADRANPAEYKRLKGFAQSKGVKVFERKISIDEFIDASFKNPKIRNYLKTNRAARTVFGASIPSGPIALPGEKSIYMGRSRSVPALAHEIGHVTGIKAFSTPKLRQAYNLTGLGAGGASLVKLYKGLRAKDSKERDEKLKGARNLSLIGGGFIAAPHLLEEARASKRALKFLPKGSRLKGAKSVLVPGFLSHAAMVTPKALLGGATIEGLRRVLKSRDARE